MITADVFSESRFAAMVDALAAKPRHHDELLALLAEDCEIYEGRGTATISRMRGWILLALARTELSDDALIYVLEELDTGIDAYLVAAAARALRAYRNPSAAIAELLVRAIANIRYRDERVSLEVYGGYAVGAGGTTPVRELLATLTEFAAHARGVLSDVEVLWQDRGLAKKYAAQMDAAIVAIRSTHDEEPSCCELPATFSWKSRTSAAHVGDVVFEDHNGATGTFRELFRDRVTLVVFFYTRCDNPLKCSLTITKLARVQQLLEERGLAQQISTVAITYDPAFDSAERIRAYGQNRGVRLDAQHRMLRTTNGLDALRRHFALGVNFIESLVNRHRVEAYIVDRQGRVAASFERLNWDENEVIERSLEVLREPVRKSFLPILGTIASIALAFFPKCALCWAAYLSVFGIAGLQQIPYAPWLRPVLALLMLVNLASVWARARATHRMTSFYLVLAGALTLLAAMQFEWRIASIAGVLLTLTGSVLNPRRAAPPANSRQCALHDDIRAADGLSRVQSL